MPESDIVLSIIIVTWNTREALDGCLASLRRHSPAAPHEVIVVDNASADGTAEMVRQRYPDVCLIESKRNLGFAGGNNLGTGQARGRFLLFLNSDTEVTRGVVDAMLGVFGAHASDRPPIGAVGCRLVYPDGRLQRSARRFPTFAAAFHQYTLLKYLQVLRPIEAREKMTDFGFDVECEVDTLMGAAVMVDRRAFEAVGGWDDRYPFRYEDADLSFRLRQSGYRLLFSPCGEVIHHSGLATKRARHQQSAAFRGMFRYFRRTRGRVVTFAFKMAFLPLRAGRLVVNWPVKVLQAAASRLHGQRDRARRRWLSALDDLHALLVDVWRMWLW